MSSIIFEIYAFAGIGLCKCSDISNSNVYDVHICMILKSTTFVSSLSATIHHRPLTYLSGGSPVCDIEEDEEKESLQIQLGPPPRPLLPPSSCPILMQLLLGIHLLFTPLARLLALGVSIHRRIAIALYFLPPSNVTEIAGTSECEQLTVVVDEHPALFNRLQI